MQQPRRQRLARQRLPAGRPGAVGHEPVREARHRHQRAARRHGLLHAVQQVQPHLPARGGPALLVVPARARGGARRLPRGQPCSHRRRRARRLPLPRAGVAVGLHRLRALRAHLPRGCLEAGGRRQGRGGRAGQLGLRYQVARARRGARQDHGQGLAVSEAPLGVQRCLRGLRRNAPRQAHDPALRGAPCDRKRHWLHLHLGRLQPFVPLHGERQGRGAGLGELPLRGQRRVWLRHAPSLPAAQGPSGDEGGRGIGGLLRGYE
mmetsp:Transcript_141334/g.439248  ORF Transcript_141334/g.439248 Transcript_141334/m.439248 type:complete len:263 (+) Transcript_141334:257-1045(+)